MNKLFIARDMKHQQQQVGMRHEIANVVPCSQTLYACRDMMKCRSAGIHMWTLHNHG